VRGAPTHEQKGAPIVNISHALEVRPLRRAAPAPLAVLPSPAPLAALPAPAADPALRVINQAVYFNGDCESCRPHCGALCCTGYTLVSLTDEEAASGRYAFKEATAECECNLCQTMRQAGVKYTLLKQRDGSCIYLDGSRRCSIYADRPQTCQRYSCKNLPFRITTG
jgi:hypothetical protein